MINTNRIFSITHEQDVDGLFCGAILKNAFRNTLVFLTNYGHKNMERVAEVIKTNTTRSKKPGTIIFTDLSVNSIEDVETIQDAAFKAKEYGWDFIWLDHHFWHKEIKRRVQSFANLILTEEHEQKCTAELVFQEFAKERTACKRMAEFAHIVDFRLPTISELPPLPELITYYRSMPNAYPKLQELMSKASRGIFWDEELQEEYENKYLALKEAAVSSAMKSLSVQNIHNYSVAIVESPRVLSKSLLAEKIFEEKPETNLVVLFAPDGKISIKRKSGSDIRCDIIASKLNGGGHSYAAGATITKNNNEPLKANQVMEVLETVFKAL